MRSEGGEAGEGQDREEGWREEGPRRRRPSGPARRTGYGCGRCGATFKSQKAAIAHALMHTASWRKTSRHDEFLGLCGAKRELRVCTLRSCVMLRRTYHPRRWRWASDIRCTTYRRAAREPCVGARQRRTESASCATGRAELRIALPSPVPPFGASAARSLQSSRLRGTACRYSHPPRCHASDDSRSRACR